MSDMEAPQAAAVSRPGSGGWTTLVLSCQTILPMRCCMSRDHNHELRRRLDALERRLDALEKRLGARLFALVGPKGRERPRQTDADARLAQIAAEIQGGDLLDLRQPLH